MNIRHKSLAKSARNIEKGLQMGFVSFLKDLMYKTEASTKAYNTEPFSTPNNIYPSSSCKQGKASCSFALQQGHRLNQDLSIWVNMITVL